MVVLPLPVGASINVCLPLAICAQPRCWTGVAAAKLCENHLRVAAPNGSGA